MTRKHRGKPAAPDDRPVSRRGLFSAFFRKGATISVAAGSTAGMAEPDAGEMAASLRPHDPEKLQAFLKRLEDAHDQGPTEE